MALAKVFISRAEHRCIITCHLFLCQVDGTGVLVKRDPGEARGRRKTAGDEGI